METTLPRHLCAELAHQDVGGATVLDASDATRSEVNIISDIKDIRDRAQRPSQRMQTPTTLDMEKLTPQCRYLIITSHYRNLLSLHGDTNTVFFACCDASVASDRATRMTLSCGIFVVDSCA